MHTILVKDLQPYENNPRNNNNAVEKVKESIKQFGFKVPIIIDKNNIIIAGHTRYKAAKKLKIDSVPCIIADDLTEEQVKAFRLADNKVAEFSEWDFDLLNIELSELDAINFDMSEFGFDFSFADEEEEITEDDFEPELPAEPKTKLGNIYQLGEHRLICGDSTNIDDIEKLMDGHEADLLLTDPPYNVNYQGSTKDKLKIQNDNISALDFKAFLTNAFFCADKFMKPEAAFYIWHADSESLNFRSACVEAGWLLKQCLIWNKNHFVVGRQDYQWKHEPCLYGWKPGAAHFWNSDRKQTTILDFDKPLRNAEHPTMKPIELFDYQIQNSTKKNDIVLDLFGGGGTSLIACEKNDRICYMSELDPKYCDVIVERWEKITGKKAVRVRQYV